MSEMKLNFIFRMVDHFTGPLRKVTFALRALGGIANGVTSKLRRLTSVMAQAGAAMSAMAGISFAGLGLGVIQTGRTFERFRNQLEGLEGSSAGAEASMAWVQNFAKQTPYELGQVMEAFIALKNYGIDPTAGSLQGLGDLSAQMGKPLMQAVEMMADAQTGEFERLKEFGIRAKATGREIAFTYVKAGKEITVSAANSAAAITGALEGIFSDKAAGAMARQSKSFDGLWSNLKDMFNDFQKMIADAGVFDFLKGELANLLTTMNRFAASGQLSKWAKDISASMVEMFKTLKAATEGVDWVAAIKGVFGFIGGTAKLIKAIGGVTGIITGAGAAAIGWLTVALMGIGATIATIAGVAVAPVAGVIALIGLIATAGWLVYRSWGDITKKCGELWNGLTDRLGGAWDGIKRVFNDGLAALWGIFPSWFRNILGGVAFAVKFAIPGAIAPSAVPGSGARQPPPAFPRPAVGGRQRFDAGGHLRISVDDHRTRVTGKMADPRMTVDTSGSLYRGANAR